MRWWSQRSLPALSCQRRTPPHNPQRRSPSVRSLTLGRAHCIPAVGLRKNGEVTPLGLSGQEAQHLRRLQGRLPVLLLMG